MGASHVETLSTRIGGPGVGDQRLLRQGRAGCGAGRCPVAVATLIEAINDPDIDAVLLATLALPTLGR